MKKYVPENLKINFDEYNLDFSLKLSMVDLLKELVRMLLFQSY